MANEKVSAHPVRRLLFWALGIGMLLSVLGWMWLLHNIGPHTPGLWESLPAGVRSVLQLSCWAGAMSWVLLAWRGHETLGTVAGVLVNGLIYAVVIFIVASIARLFRRRAA
jgi:hypothetical protein